MKPDPIIEEIHSTRQSIAERFQGDLRAICEDTRRRQQASGRPTRRLPARPARPVTPAKAS